MALYRLASVKYVGLDIQKSWILMKGLLILEVVFNLLAFSVAFAALDLTGTAVSMSFCRGKSMTMEKILHQPISTRDDIGLGQTVLALFFFGGQFLFCTEFFCYIWIFAYLIQSEKNVKASLSLNILKQRRRRNFLTLSGQFLTFLVKFIGASLVLSILLIFEVDPVWPAVNASFMSSALAISNCLASPELRRHYFYID